MSNSGDKMRLLMEKMDPLLGKEYGSTKSEHPKSTAFGKDKGGKSKKHPFYHKMVGDNKALDEPDKPKDVLMGSKDLAEQLQQEYNTYLEGYKLMPPLDTEKHPERPGLEGPFRMKSGRVVYYDPKEGKYYDASTDMYIDSGEVLDEYGPVSAEAGVAPTNAVQSGAVPGATKPTNLPSGSPPNAAAAPGAPPVPGANPNQKLTPQQQALQDKQLQQQQQQQPGGIAGTNIKPEELIAKGLKGVNLDLSKPDSKPVVDLLTKQLSKNLGFKQ